MPLGNNLPLHDVPGFADAAQWPMGLGDVHADTIFVSWACMVGILGAAALVRPTLVANGPGNGFQAVGEMLYDFIADITKGQIGHDWKKFFPLIAAIFIFVLIANFSGILPWEWIAERFANWPKHGEELFEVAAPTTDFNVTFGLALVALLTYLGAGFASHGLGYLKAYINPIEWLDLVIRPSTLALRLMMVITADELMRGAALMMVPMLLPVGVMGFEMFIAVIQAFVFALLTSIYIGLTLAHH